MISILVRSEILTSEILRSSWRNMRLNLRFRRNRLLNFNFSFFLFLGGFGTLAFTFSTCFFATVSADFSIGLTVSGTTVFSFLTTEISFILIFSSTVFVFLSLISVTGFSTAGSGFSSGVTSFLTIFFSAPNFLYSFFNASSLPDL